MSHTGPRAPTSPLGDQLVYSLGEIPNSLVMNSIWGFAMLYYTEALGVSYKWAGVAMSIATIWEAITDPIMGHITDNTRSRWGRRHPYILLGGILTAMTYYFIWAVPGPLREGGLALGYLMVMNLLLRTTYTLFLIPYGALGMEICTDYEGRARLAGIRGGVQMLANLLGPALAWSLFFKDVPGQESTKITENYTHMGTAFTLVSLFFFLFVVWATRKYMVDSRSNAEITGNRLSDFYRDLKEVITDPNPRPVYLFTLVIYIGIVLVSSLQMYVYVHFMHFSAGEKTLVHGGGMTLFGLSSAFIAPWLVRKLDKKPAVVIGVLVTVIANILLLGLFVSGWVTPGTGWQLPPGLPWVGGMTLPVAMLLFGFLQASYWGGNGILGPISGSMIADISEIGKYHTGILRDGTYSAIACFISKMSCSLGLLLSGFCLDGVGFVSGSEVQSPTAIRYLAAIAFSGGMVVALLALLIILKYPVNRAFMQKIKAALAQR